MKKLALYSVVFSIFFVLAIMFDITPSDAELGSEADSKDLLTITGKVAESETFFSADGGAYQIVLMSDGKYYVRRINKTDLIFGVGDEVLLTIHRQWKKYEGERFYERYPEAITVHGASLKSIPVITDGKSDQMKIKN